MAPKFLFRPSPWYHHPPPALALLEARLWPLDDINSHSYGVVLGLGGDWLRHIARLPPAPETILRDAPRCAAMRRGHFDQPPSSHTPYTGRLPLEESSTSLRHHVQFPAQVPILILDPWTLDPSIHPSIQQSPECGRPVSSALLPLASPSIQSVNQAIPYTVDEWIHGSLSIKAGMQRES